MNIANAQVKKESKDTLLIKPKIFNGLKKAEPGDIDPGQPMMLNPSETPMYKEDYSLVEQSEFMTIMMSNNYIPEPYIDSNKVVKVFVLRKATEFEKKQMNEMQNKMANPSPLVGKKAFDFNVTDIFGNKYSLKELKGKVIVMNFWFVECKPCIMEMPELNKLVEKYRNKDVVFLGFATNDKQKIESFLKNKTFNYNIIAESKKIADLYEVNSFPTHIVIDKNSTIAYYVIGLGPTTIEDLDRIIKSLIK
ncbi:MAG: TlpA family protein disulfide reductase [Sphingomonadales bacterium]